MKKELLRALPSVDELARMGALKDAAQRYSAALVTDTSRTILEEARAGILNRAISEVSKESLAGLVLKRLQELHNSSFVKIINASGTILHTNIGRAVLSKEAVEAINLSAEGNVNLEFDLETGERGQRDSHVEGLLKRLTNCEAAAVVNNNAASVLITLNTLAEGKEVIISRGELIEIGGSFRLPEIIKKSGCILKEVGATNRTHPEDYVKAITPDTALILKAHTSNYKVIGFTSEVGLEELAAIGKAHGVPVVEDLGSGSLIDLSLYGLPKEPVVGERVASGADLVTFSGDKLLGGPQAGIITGKKEFIERIRKNPLKRALRADKLTLSALEATLRLYLNNEKLKDVLPSLRYMTRPLADIEEKAVMASVLLENALGPDFNIEVLDGESVVGGGALPEYGLPTKVVSITSGKKSPDDIFKLFLNNRPAILGRIHKDRFMLDLRTIEDAALVVPSTLTGR
ncbi:MAG: L-seryl-tRNA(Sec) selenium transferase [Deltaproteobacteria bacterium]|nr:L-seryl-tRNA(Sec) selenium transferase [Deltaproteobacteria bacterium]